MKNGLLLFGLEKEHLHEMPNTCKNCKHKEHAPGKCYYPVDSRREPHGLVYVHELCPCSYIHVRGLNLEC